jgi:hypothetical protein
MRLPKQAKSVDRVSVAGAAPNVESTRIEPQALKACKCPCCIEVAGHLVCCE